MFIIAMLQCIHVFLLFEINSGDVRLVDYEFGGPNYLAFDIADHFAEFAGTVHAGM